MESTKKIFINYRRKDVLGLVDDFYQCLFNAFGDEIFFDVKGIGKGEIITDNIKQNIKACRLFLPVIGPNWDSEQYLKRLHDPMDWVRQELELAKALKKFIIPIFIFRDDPPDPQNLPESLRTGLFDRNAIKLTEETCYWPVAVRENMEMIKAHTGLEPVNRIPERIDDYYKKLTYCLNRDSEIKKLKELRSNKQALVSASGTDRSRFDFFIERCGIDEKTVFKGILPGAIVKQLSWQNFSASPVADYQHCLCSQIAGALLLPTENVREEALLELVKIHFSKLANGQNYVFWAIRRGESAFKHTGGAIGVWWNTWQTLLGQRESQNILVLLFTVPGWLQRCMDSLHLFKSKPHYIGDFNSKINRLFIDNWKDNFDVYLQNCNKKDSFDQTVLESELAKHFSKRKTIEFKQAVDSLSHVLTMAYRPKKEFGP